MMLDERLSETKSVELDDAALLRYSRHILLDEIGVEGQAVFLKSRVLIVGMGGLGCPAALYLASSGIGELVLVDEDVVEESNLQRQILYHTDHLNQAKAQVAKNQLNALYPNVCIVSHQLRATPERLAAWVNDVDLVLDCTDNFLTRYAINQACLAARKPLVSGAAIGWLAQCAVYDFRLEKQPCYHCVFPDGDAVDEVRCATSGVLAPLVGMVGCQQAALALRALLPTLQAMPPHLLRMDLRLGQWQMVRIKRDHECVVCGDHSG